MRLAIIVIVISVSVGVVVSWSPLVGATILVLGLGLAVGRKSIVRAVGAHNSESRVAPAWPLIAMPTLLGLRAWEPHLVTLILMVLVVTLSVRAQNYRISWPIFILTVIAIAFAQRRDSIALETLNSALLVALLYFATRRYGMKRGTDALLGGIALYLCVNVVLFYIFGLDSPQATDRLAGMVGGSLEERAFFPLTTSVNLPPNLAAAFLVATAPRLLASPIQAGLFIWLGVVAGITVLWGASSRASILLTLVLILAVIVIPVLSVRLTRVVLVMFAFGAVALPVVVVALSSPILWLGRYLPLIDRGSGIEEIQTLNGRTYIWQVSAEAWRDANPIDKILGFGHPGTTLSNASNGFAYLFRDWMSDPTLATAHNSSLQQLLDAGVVGLVALMFVAILAGGALRRRYRMLPLAATSLAFALLALAGAAMTEASLAPGLSQETFWVFIAFCFFASASPMLDTKEVASGTTTDLRQIAEGANCTDPVRTEAGRGDVG